MTMADLKTGMILEFINGKLAMVLLGTENGDIVSGQTWFPLSNMSGKNLFCDEYLGYGIKRVYQPICNRDYLDGGISKHGCDMIWERKETKEYDNR